jgi:hypothetical protein
LNGTIPLEVISAIVNGEDPEIAAEMYIDDAYLNAFTETNGLSFDFFKDMDKLLCLFLEKFPNKWPEMVNEYICHLTDPETMDTSGLEESKRYSIITSWEKEEYLADIIKEKGKTLELLSKSDSAKDVFHLVHLLCILHLKQFEIATRAQLPESVIRYYEPVNYLCKSEFDDDFNESYCGLDKTWSLTPIDLSSMKNFSLTMFLKNSESHCDD